MSKIWTTGRPSQFIRGRETLLIISHSYGQKLESAGFSRMISEGHDVDVKYVYRSGATYNTYLTDSTLFSQIASANPHFVLVILAGNSISSDTSRQTIKRQCLEFYHRLRFELPDAVIIGAQAETRFYGEDNKWHAPTGRQYKSDRHFINNLLARSVKEIDHILMLGGPARLDRRELYESNGYHLNRAGWRVYWSHIKGMIDYIHKQIEQRLRCEGKLLRLDQKCQRK